MLTIIKKYLRVLIATVVYLYGSMAVAAPFQFTNFYFFGDSLTDSNTNPYWWFANKQTNGAVWAELLGSRYGVQVRSIIDGGHNNYALVTSTTASLNLQINLYLDYIRTSGQQVDSQALYSLWGGPNDFFNCAQGDTACLTSAAGNAINNLVQGVNMLGTAGAQYFLVINMVDFSQVPKYSDAGGYTADQRNQISTLVTAFNLGLTLQMNQLNYNIIQVDIRSMLNALIANPARYGFTNITDTCQNNTSLCTTYLFWDNLHPSSAGHEMIFYTVASYLEGPVYAAMLGEAPFGTLNAYHTALGNELLDLRTGKMRLPVGHLRPFANVNYAVTREDGSLFDPGLSSNSQLAPIQNDPIQGPIGFKSKSTNFIVGADYRLNEQMLVGAAIGRTSNQVNFGGNGGGVTLLTNFVSAFGGYQFSRGYIQAMLSAGVIAFNDFTRNIRLRKTIDIWDMATGSAKGTQLGTKIEAGWRLFEHNGFQTGPIANAGYQAVHVDAFGEQGATSGLNLQYVPQSTKSLVTGLGWQVSHTARVGSVVIKPYLQAMYNREWMRFDRQMGASALSLGASPYYLPAPSVTGLNGRTWGLVDVGISTQFRNGITVGLAYQTTVALAQGQASMVMATVQVPF